MLTEPFLTTIFLVTRGLIVFVLIAGTGWKALDKTHNFLVERRELKERVDIDRQKILIYEVFTAFLSTIFISAIIFNSEKTNPLIIFYLCALTLFFIVICCGQFFIFLNEKFDENREK